MKIIKLFVNEKIAVEGRATDEKELLPALEMVLKTINNIPGTQVEMKEGKLDELVEDIKGCFLTTYDVKGVYFIGNNKASVSMEVKAVSEDEAIEKVKNLGLINPYIEKHCNENDYQEEESKEDEENRKTWDRIEHEVCGDCSYFDDCLWRKGRSGCRWR